LATTDGDRRQHIARNLAKCSQRIQVLKTEQLPNEKVTLINKMTNQFFVQTIINIFAVAIILTLRAF
jgi:hypothetical protein